MISLLITSIITGMLRAFYNWAVWAGNGKLWHKGQAAFIGFFTAGMFYFMQVVDFNFFSLNSSLDYFLNTLLLSVYFLTPHWILNDGLYNIFRRLNWFYYNIEGDSTTDKLGKIKYYIQALLLLFCIVITYKYYI